MLSLLIVGAQDKVPPPLALKAMFTLLRSHVITPVRLSSACPPVKQSSARGADILVHSHERDEEGDELWLASSSSHMCPVHHSSKGLRVAVSKARDHPARSSSSSPQGRRLWLKPPCDADPEPWPRRKIRRGLPEGIDGVFWRGSAAAALWSYGGSEIRRDLREEIDGGEIGQGLL